MTQISLEALEKVVKKTIEAVETGKTQIFEIAEAARAEYVRVKDEVDSLKRETAAIIKDVDILETKEHMARVRLMEVSRDFQRYSEQDIKAAYEEAQHLQIQLLILREREQHLRRRRDDLELRLRSLKSITDKAEALVSQVGVALGYLGSEMGNVYSQIETLQQKQLIASRIIKAQEEERKRIAREIHDGPAQAMANLIFRSEVCQRLMEVDLERAKQELEQLRDQVRLCLKETRKIIFDLRPMALDDLGLVPTLRHLIDVLKKKERLDVELVVTGTEIRLLPVLEIALFRVIQEALNNVEKHANASFVRVRLDFGPQRVAAIVEDNGQGFELKKTMNNGSEHFGLLSMRERVELLHGKLEIKSVPGRGTKVSIKIPIKEKSEE